MAFGGSIKLTGESEYRKALKDITSDMRLMSSEMKVLATSTSASGASSDADRAKKEQLSKAIADQRDKIEALNKALADSNAANGETSASSKALQTQINNATANLNRMETSLNSTGKETNALGGEMDGTGKKAGVFGDVLKANLASEAIIGGIKGIANGVKALGGAFVDMVGDSVKAYADYEQLVGGVETLFKDAAPKVQSYANQAFSTAGISANQYMEQVTSFSATLLQGLGGDTNKAAEAANGAITDMSDNANKLGTDVSLIQNAYQGFAKDNFTMLDNLKLGYGGTAEEMARLVNNSGVLANGVKVTAETVKDVPFDQIIAAIHKTQDQLGITGTTAKEASTTISGSFNSVKASWENVLASFGSGSNEQISQAIDGLVQGATNLITNVTAIIPNIITGVGQLVTQLIAKLPELLTQIIPVVINILNTLFQTIANVLPQLVPVVIQLLNSLVQLIITNLPMIIQAGIDVLLGLIDGITQAIPQLIPQIVLAIETIITTLVQNLPAIILAGIQLLVAIVQGLADALPQLIQYIPQIINTLITALTNPTMLNLIIRASIQLLIAIITGIIGAIPSLIAAVPQIITAIVNGIKNGIGSLVSIGGDLIKGLWNGISGQVGWIMDKIKGFGSSVMNGIKSFFGIKSPSRKMKDEVGKMLGLGVGEGFTESMVGVTKDMQAALPTSFDTGVNVLTDANSSLNATRSSGTTIGGINVPALAAAVKEALGGMNVVLDDEKVGSFVTDTIEKKVFG